MRSNNGAIDMMQSPVQLPGLVGAFLQRDQNAVPDAGASPAIEAGGHRLPRSIVLWQVPPGSARPIQPENAIDDAAMIHIRAATAGLPRWKQWPQPLPLRVGQISSVHTPLYIIFDVFCKQGLVASSSIGM